MKVIIAGSRSITEYSIIKQAVEESGFSITEIVSGMAKGVDKLGEQYANEKSILLKQFPADWSKGRHAGFTRNVQMAEYADALIAIWDGQSKGTAHMINIARGLKLKIFIK